MKAIELYRQDQAGGNEFIRDQNRERRQYYLSMRQALRDECAAGGPCGLLESFGERMDAKQLTHMYLLDAAAVWECYEGVIEKNRYTRDIGVGLPFPIGGRTLKWNDVQRMAANGTLPAAVVDAELWNRLTALLNYCAAGGRLAEQPPVNPRATLQTADRRDTGLPPAAYSPASAAESAPLTGSELLRQLESLRADNAALRQQLAQLQQQQDTTREYALRAAGSILAGKAEEARAIASQLDERLRSAVLELEQAAADRRALEDRVARAQEKLAADRAQLDALLRQEQEAARSAAAARAEREQAQRAAARTIEEQQTAQAELAAAADRLKAETKTLRELRLKAGETRRACEMTQRQITGLS